VSRSLVADDLRALARRVLASRHRECLAADLVERVALTVECEEEPGPDCCRLIEDLRGVAQGLKEPPAIRAEAARVLCSLRTWRKHWLKRWRRRAS